ncbi:YciI family protein [Chryseobacterium sp. CBSDS_008]|uniref:YciI family protein n=1 Tax=Chryseobacterium sp. CBSDS_008 TaxID=3415265 RepID=UPI003CEBE54C
MFIISLTYKRSIETIERFIPQHAVFLDKHYESGRFMPQEEKNPERVGLLSPKQNLKRRLRLSLKILFYIHEAADYAITEFIPSKYNENFKFFIEA